MHEQESIDHPATAGLPLFNPSWDRVESCSGLVDLDNSLIIDESSSSNPSNEEGEEQQQQHLKTEITSLSTSNVELELIGRNQYDENVVLQSKHKHQRQRRQEMTDKDDENNSTQSASTMSIDELIRKDMRFVERTFSGDESSSPSSRGGGGGSYSSLSLEARELLRSIAKDRAPLLEGEEGKEPSNNDDNDGNEAKVEPPKIQRNVQPLEFFKNQGGGKKMKNNKESKNGSSGTKEAKKRTASTIESAPTFDEDVFAMPAMVAENDDIDNEDDATSDNLTSDDNADEEEGTLTLDDDNSTVDSTLDNSTLTSRETKGTKESGTVVVERQLGCNDGDARRALMGIQPRCSAIEDAMDAMPPLPLRTVDSSAVVAQGCNAMTPLGVPSQWFDNVQNNVLDVVDRIDYAINGHDDDVYSDEEEDNTTVLSDEETEEEPKELYNKKSSSTRSRNSRRYHRHRHGREGGDNINEGSRRSLHERSRDYNRHKKRRERRHHRRRNRDQQRGRSSSPAQGREGGDLADNDGAVQVGDVQVDDLQRAYQVRFSPGTIVEEPTEGEGSGGTSGKPVGDAGMNQVVENKLVDGSTRSDTIHEEDEDSFDDVHQLFGASVAHIPSSDIPKTTTESESSSVANARSFWESKQQQQQQQGGGEGAGSSTTKRIDRISRSLTHKKRSFGFKREWSAKSGGTTSVDFSAKSSPA